MTIQMKTSLSPFLIRSMMIALSATPVCVFKLECMLQPAAAAENNASQKSARSPSMSAYEKLLKQLEQEVRQGNEAAARTTIDKLGKVEFKDDCKTEVSQGADFLIGKERWDLAKLFLERIPKSEPGWGYVLIKRMCSDAKLDATKLDAIYSWIKARYPANPDYWCHLRVIFGQEAGRKDRVFQELAKEVKDNPKDLDAVKRYINASTELSDQKDISWICDAINPQLAYDNYRVAEWLRRRYPKEAVHYLKRAKTLPFTQQDEKALLDYMRKNTARAMLTPIDAAKEFSTWTRGMLAECYQKSGDSKSAQELLVQLSKETGGQAPVYALTQLAGQIQATTPTKPLEAQIKQAEPANENSISYWLGRAAYYRGRSDVAKEREALDHALGLAKAKKDENWKFYHPGVVSDFARFLKRNESEKAALAFVWKEFDANQDLDFRKLLVREIEMQLETDQTHYLSPTDERLWAVLSHASVWKHDEERLLWRMARNAQPGDQRAVLWKRAEQLARNNESREAVLGWVMNRTQEPKRSIPLLQAACKTKDAELKSSAQFTLFESYLDAADWKHAEEIWNAASQRLTDNEKPDWLSRIALAAARSGDKENALRLWKSKDKVDLSAIGLLGDMVKQGMKEPLMNYYRGLKKTRPQSTVPDEALKVLSSANE